MKLYAIATIDSPQEKDNLCKAIRALGGQPQAPYSEVSLEFSGAKEKCDEFIELFERYPRHGVYTEG